MPFSSHASLPLPCCSFTLQPGVLHPDWHQEQLPTYYWLQQQRAKGGCLHRHSWGAHCAAGSDPPPRIKELGIAGRIETEDNGFLVIKVRNAFGAAGSCVSLVG